jgi:U2 small nuclear ribonucleoprotein B''
MMTEQQARQPNATLYVKNIDWKLKKNLVKKALYTLFTRHGKVLDVIVLRHNSLRGQAFVIMNDIQAATNALISEQGFTFYNKDLIIEYAKQPSFRYHQRPSDKNDPNQRIKLQRQRKGQNPRSDDDNDNDDDANDMNQLPPNKRVKVETETKDDDVEGIIDEESEKHEEQTQQKQQHNLLPPSRILLVHDIPSDIMSPGDHHIRTLFQPYNGFIDVRLLTSQNKAVIEFQEESYATIAIQALQHFALTPTYQIQLSYGKE